MVALTQRMPKMIIMQELSTNIGRAQTEWIYACSPATISPSVPASKTQGAQPLRWSP